MKCYDRFLNRLASSRTISPIRATDKFYGNDKMVYLAGGLPSSNAFPVTGIQFSLLNGNCITVSPEEVRAALQYGKTPGYPDLVMELMKIQEKYHRLPKGYSLIVTAGCQDGLCKAIEAMMEYGDYVILEELTYSGFLSAVSPYDPKYLVVKGDEYGMNPKSLRSVLSRWDPEDVRSRSTGVPKMLYIVPNGYNSTGSCITLERKKEIYQIAQEYDLMILEDDPYFFLTFQDNLIPSFLSLDTDGRVIRCDSVSKIMSAGLRCGYLTGPDEMVSRIVLHMQASVFHASMLSQILLLNLLRNPACDSFQQMVDNARSLYKERRDKAVYFAKNNLGSLVEFKVPQSGIFLWIKVNGIKDTRKLVLEKCTLKGVILVPGASFIPNNTDPSPYVRLSYANATDDDLDRGTRLLAEAIVEDLKSTPKQNGDLKTTLQHNGDLKTTLQQNGDLKTTLQQNGDLKTRLQQNGDLKSTPRTGGIQNGHSNGY